MILMHHCLNLSRTNEAFIRLSKKLFLGKELLKRKLAGFIWNMVWLYTLIKPKYFGKNDEISILQVLLSKNKRRRIFRVTKKQFWFPLVNRVAFTTTDASRINKNCHWIIFFLPALRNKPSTHSLRSK